MRSGLIVWHSPAWWILLSSVPCPSFSVFCERDWNKQFHPKSFKFIILDVLSFSWFSVETSTTLLRDGSLRLPLVWGSPPRSDVAHVTLTLPEGLREYTTRRSATIHPDLLTSLVDKIQNTPCSAHHTSPGPSTSLLFVRVSPQAVVN